jgi:hypothetical protein
VSELVDANGVTWEITSPGGDAFVGKVAASSRRTYVNPGRDVDELATDDATLTWPAGGEPILVGTGNGVRIVIAFATAQKPAVVDRTPASPPANTGGGSNVGLILIIVGGLWALSKLRRRRRG